MRRTSKIILCTIAVLTLIGCGGGTTDPLDAQLECNLTQSGSTTDSASARVICSDEDGITEAYVELKGDEQSRMVLTLPAETTSFDEDVNITGLEDNTTYQIIANVSHIKGSNDEQIDTLFEGNITTKSFTAVDCIGSWTTVSSSCVAGALFVQEMYNITTIAEYGGEECPYVNLSINMYSTEDERCIIHLPI